MMKPASAAIPGAVAELLREAPLSDGKIAFAWKVAVGPALDRATAVKLDGTVLLVDVASAQWAREIKRSTRLILPRLRALLGRETITEIRVRS
jgi:predicted nucleic acid-binding Zn ribbon protein